MIRLNVKTIVRVRHAHSPYPWEAKTGESGVQDQSLLYSKFEDCLKPYLGKKNLKDCSGGLCRVV